MKAKGKRGAGEGEASLLLLVEWREPWREEAKGWAREHGPLTVGLRKQERPEWPMRGKAPMSVT